MNEVTLNITIRLTTSDKYAKRLQDPQKLANNIVIQCFRNNTRYVEDAKVIQVVPIKEAV